MTGFAHSTKDIDGLLEIVGGAPLVVKLLEGTQGIGVVLAETQQGGRVGHRRLPPARRQHPGAGVHRGGPRRRHPRLRHRRQGGRGDAAPGPPGEFRSNLHRGGTAEKIKLTPEERTTAIRAAKIMGLNVAGVDLLRSNHGPVVMEVNSSPGLEGIEGATGVDVAGKIIEFVEKNSPAPAPPDDEG